MNKQLDLNYKKHGSGEPVFILHGLFGMLDNWKTFARMLENDYEVYLIDQRNHGKSPHSDVHSYEAMAGDIVHLMDSLQLDSVSIIGHSMGAKTAMRTAQLYPDRIKSLIAVDMGTENNSSSHGKYFEAMLNLQPEKISRRSEARKKLNNLLGEPSVVMFLLKNLMRDDNGNYAWKFNLDTLYNEYENILKGLPSDAQYDGPVMFIGGGNSDYISKEDEQKFKKYFPNARLEIIPGAGHWIHVDQRDKLLELVRNFLSGN